MRVLLVDDESDLASALAERLGLRGITADWVSSGEEALIRAAATCYDVAVLDMRMPKIGGLELQRRLQAICPGLKFIFLTGYGSEKDFREVACQMGEACYLIKPIDIEVLIERINTLVPDKGEEHG
jgi:DNA-binding response OmpR family regulator